MDTYFSIGGPPLPFMARIGNTWYRGKMATNGQSGTGGKWEINVGVIVVFSGITCYA